MFSKYSTLFLSILLLAGCKPNFEPVDTPEGFPSFEILVNQGDAFDGYIMLREISEPGAHFLIDNNGAVVWLSQTDSKVIRVYSFHQGSILSLETKEIVVETNLSGDTLNVWDLPKLGITNKLHHEVTSDNEGNILAITHESMPIDLSFGGGEVNDTLKFDGIIKFDRGGKVLWQWKLTDVLDPLDDPNVVKMKKDWGHANSLAIDIDNNYLISFRDFNQVWKVNSTNGNVIWKYGDDTIEDLSNRFYGQHAIHLNLEGDYMIYDNGNVRNRKTSRALAFQKQEDGFVTKLKIELPDSLFNWKQGSVYQINADRFLFCNSMRKKLVITDRSGDILWMAKTDTEFYRAYYIKPN